MDLRTPLSQAIRTTRDFLSVLEEMQLRTVGDLLLYLPRMHEDLSKMATLAGAPENEKVTIRGTVTKLKFGITRTRKKLVTGKFTDAEGTVSDVVWFNQPHIMRMLSDGQEVVFTGKIVEQGRKLVWQSPQFELAGSKPLLHSGRLVPIYPHHDVITSKWLREKMAIVARTIDLLPETLPQDIVEAEGLMARRDAVRALHFPESADQVQRARDRIAFEEAFALQKEALDRKRQRQSARSQRLRIPMDIPLIRSLFKSLHFTPTDDQRRAIYEILKDMEGDIPMSRLLEGDVGSGKTLVAAAVMANVLRRGGQCALMAPTEVLAKQHTQSVAKLLLTLHAYLERQRTSGAPDVPPFNLPSIGLLTGSTAQTDAADILRRVAQGTLTLLIGTHALLEESVRFADLRLVIVDEQHRFGVEQRRRLMEKGHPHFLTMTATPIPRTLALTAYGHHDLSVLLTKPGNRKSVQTKVIAPRDRATVERFIEKSVEEGRQVFVICPLIEASDTADMRDVKNVQSEADRLRKAMPSLRVALLHGRMTPQEKDDVMRAFKERSFDLLVSTSVIEVGIDVPNATIICIEGAERFGLAQLHQLRGRVGRGDHQSYCFLFATTSAHASSPRLKAMEEHASGFLLAEIDLKLRGPGEIYGLRQSGIPESALQQLLNPELIMRARRAAEGLIGVKMGKEGI
jgi:ATP-dependent DNA helicase RecG